LLTSRADPRTFLFAMQHQDRSFSMTAPVGARESAPVQQVVVGVGLDRASGVTLVAILGIGLLGLIGPGCGRPA
jgi:hypothetical protein